MAYTTQLVTRSPRIGQESSGSTSDAEMKKKKGNRAMGKKKFPKASGGATVPMLCQGYAHVGHVTSGGVPTWDGFTVLWGI